MKKYETQYTGFEHFLKRNRFRILRLGGDQYTMDAPLRAVINLMKKCKGAIILGYPQYQVTATISKAMTVEQSMDIIIPTPWNQIEAALAFKQKIPVLIDNIQYFSHKFIGPKSLILANNTGKAIN